MSEQVPFTVSFDRCSGCLACRFFMATTVTSPSEAGITVLSTYTCEVAEDSETFDYESRYAAACSFMSSGLNCRFFETFNPRDANHVVLEGADNVYQMFRTFGEEFEYVDGLPPQDEEAGR